MDEIYHEDCIVDPTHDDHALFEQEVVGEDEDLLLLHTLLHETLNANR